MAVNKGALGDVLGTAEQRERAGRGAEEARHHRQRGADRGQRMGRPPRGHGQRGDGQHLRGAQPLSAGRVPAAVRPARRLEQHRRQRQHRHHLLRAEEARRHARRAGGRLPAGRQPAGGGRLLHLRAADHAGADGGRRRRDVHARPRAGLLRADAGEHPHPGRHEGIRDQHEQHAPLGRAGASATSTNAWPARTARAARTSTCAGSPAWWPTCTAS